MISFKGMLFVFFSFFLFPVVSFAQNCATTTPITASLGPPRPPGGISLYLFLQILLGIVTKLAIPVLAVLLIYWGFKFVSALGNDTEIIEAKHRFKIGLAVLAVFLALGPLATIIYNTGKSIGFPILFPGGNGGIGGTSPPTAEACGFFIPEPVNGAALHRKSMAEINSEFNVYFENVIRNYLITGIRLSSNPALVDRTPPGFENLVDTRDCLYDAGINGLVFRDAANNSNEQGYVYSKFTNGPSAGKWEKVASGDNNTIQIGPEAVRGKLADSNTSLVYVIHTHPTHSQVPPSSLDYIVTAYFLKELEATGEIHKLKFAAVDGFQDSTGHSFVWQYSMSSTGGIRAQYAQILQKTRELIESNQQMVDAFVVAYADYKDLSPSEEANTAWALVVSTIVKDALTGLYGTMARDNAAALKAFVLNGPIGAYDRVQLKFAEGTPTFEDFSNIISLSSQLGVSLETEEHPYDECTTAI